MLTLEWRPHSGPDALPTTPDGRIRASDLRALFRRYREGPAGVMVPSHPSPHHLSEMTCFDRPWCRCLHYDGADVPVRTGSLERAGPLRDALGYDRECTYQRIFDRHQAGDRQIKMSRHAVAGNLVCLSTTYRYSINICHKTDEKINPSHDWFHAMDPAMSLLGGDSKQVVMKGPEYIPGAWRKYGQDATQIMYLLASRCSLI